MLGFTGIALIFLTHSLKILAFQNNQTIKIVDGFDTIRQSRGVSVEPNAIINELFAQAPVLASNEKVVSMLSYKKDSYKKFMTNDESS